jgi:flagellar biosynthetic protein FliR
VSFSEAQILSTVAGFSWVLLRVSAMFVALPLFAGHLMPVPARALVATATTLLIWPTLPAMPEVALFSLPGILIGIQQFLIGLAIGFVLHLAFAAIVFGGQSASYSMGLGFAALVDPVSGVQIPVIAQFYQILAILLFLALDGHLMVIQLLAESFRSVPVGSWGPSRESLWDLAMWASRLFAAGLLLSLPIVAALLLVNLGFGVATRAAPQLNIFSVGFPVSMLLGLVLMGITLPDVLNLFSGFLDESYRLIARIF